MFKFKKEFSMFKFNSHEFDIDSWSNKNAILDIFLNYLRYSVSGVKFKLTGISALIEHFAVPMQESHVVIEVLAPNSVSLKELLNKFLESSELNRALDCEQADKLLTWDYFEDDFDDNDYCSARLCAEDDGTYFSLILDRVSKLEKGYISLGNECVYPLSVVGKEASGALECSVHDLFAAAYVISVHGSKAPMSLREVIFEYDLADMFFHDALCEDFATFIYTSGLARVIQNKYRNGELPNESACIEYLKDFQLVLADWLTGLAKRFKYDTVFTYNPDDDNDVWYKNLLENILKEA